MENQILVIGDLILDKYIIGDVRRISPEAPIQILNEKYSEIRLGGAANVANNLKSIKSEFILFSKLGDDKQSKDFLKLLRNKGIATSSIISCPNNSVTIKTRFISNNQCLLRSDKDINYELNKLDILKLDKLIKKKKIKYVYLSDYNKGIVSENLVKFLIKKKLSIFVDPKNDLSFFRSTDYVKFNFDYFREKFLSNNFIKNTENIKKKLLQLKLKYKIKNIILTDGAHGSYILNKNSFFHKINAKSVDVFDVTGAGDTFGSVFIANKIKQMDDVKALELASLAASQVITKMGTAVYQNEFDDNKNKILYQSQTNFIKKICEEKKNDRLKIGFTNGCFDLLHPGHLDNLKKCKDLCDFLIVGLNSDKSVKILKGSKRPIFPEKYRAQLLSYLKFVDLIIIFKDKTPINIIKNIKPDLLFKGSDYKNKEIVGANILKNNKGKIKLIPLLEGWSTSKLIK